MMIPHEERTVMSSASTQPQAVIASWIWRAVPSTARLTGSPSRPSEVRVRAMKYPGTYTDVTSVCRRGSTR